MAMHIDDHPRRKWMAVLAIAMLTLSGCRTNATSPMSCRVLIDGVPALGVRVTLLRSDQGEFNPVLEGISDASGAIAMMLVDGAKLPTESELELTAMVESVGSGDWQLNAPWSSPQKSPLKVKWPPSQATFEILLPRKAIKSI